MTTNTKESPERTEISLHEVRIYQTLCNESSRWFTNRAIAKQLSMPERTVRMHTRRFATLGIVDLVEVFPGHRYRWSPKAGKRNAAYVQRLQCAVEVFETHDD